jgi:His-Xaa-Ser system protein HxsD
MNKNDNVSMNIDTALYPIEAVTKAARKYIENFNVKINFFGQDKIVEVLFSLKKSGSLALADVEEDFMNEIILETVRYNVLLQTKTLREMIVGRALYRACVQV